MLMVLSDSTLPCPCWQKVLQQHGCLWQKALASCGPSTCKPPLRERKVERCPGARSAMTCRYPPVSCEQGRGESQSAAALRECRHSCILPKDMDETVSVF